MKGTIFWKDVKLIICIQVHAAFTNEDAVMVPNKYFGFEF